LDLGLVRAYMDVGIGRRIKSSHSHARTRRRFLYRIPKESE
jgi:hypothetical protein